MYTLSVLNNTAKFISWRRKQLSNRRFILTLRKTASEKAFHPIARQLAYQFNDTVKFQYLIHINQIRSFILDFYFPKLKIAIEIDGETHESEQSKYYDAKRTKSLESKGIQVLRFKNNDVKFDILNVIPKIEEAFKNRIAESINNCKV